MHVKSEVFAHFYNFNILVAKKIDLERLDVFSSLMVVENAHS